ncbi:FKBP-type peptidyl-prolyl cis-trans isomerase [Ruicaihuangia caeni]|uniref:Peptidyl-prolyl cis-trans isomerase n=1 Tax=Ruicaihuangia caeni TaxID=3042517 RepID=A0AAW6T8U0_9MICO|nr:FKBP-type peptidyl-prolyl cis-trans isomerase [Klugiella sp. YN-L-19]MDI2098193.1 FKBP-type peptidyl-prolyl cis-trans isomerase [Klugiella sp. YN-L-19]
MRKTPALAIAAALLASLTACTASSSAANGCGPFEPGKASELVEATGPVGQQPRASFPTPLIAQDTERSVLVEGEGDRIQEGQVVDMQVTLYLGETGQVLTETSYDPDQPVRRVAGDDEDFFGSIVECAKPGGRIASATTVEAVYGENALLNIGIGNDVTLIAVVDVERAFLGKANGPDQLATNGMPAVVTAPDGTPGITLPNESAPDDLRLALSKRGGGEVVERGDRVVVHFTALDWERNRVLQSTWDRKAPASWLIEDIEDDAQGIAPGLLKGLVGAPVGSQLVAVIPPSEGFPQGSGPGGASADSTVVYVVDVLGIQ